MTTQPSAESADDKSLPTEAVADDDDDGEAKEELGLGGDGDHSTVVASSSRMTPSQIAGGNCITASPFSSANTGASSSIKDCKAPVSTIIAAAAAA